MDMARVSVVQTRPDDWAYLSEGGSTIVFSYTGPLSTFTGKVLRLRKISLAGAVHDKVIGQEDDDPVIVFQKTVIATLVSSKYLPELDVIFLDPQWLVELGELRNHDRPAERQKKDQIDKTRQKGLLATDLIGGDILAIEIKPKWGFLPNPAHMSQETAKIKTSTCRFCMHTRLRSKGGDLPTQYCPLDLFSSDEARMRKAIHDLWDGWAQSDGGLNNMKIFVSGKMIRPSESLYSLEEFLSTKTEVVEALATALLPSLRAPALGIISDLQRSLDALDIEGLTKLYAIAHPDTKDLGSAEHSPSLKQLQDFAASYHSVYRPSDHSRLRPEKFDTYLMAYLLSATFKDCSIIFRLCRSEHLSVDSPGAISIIDLDLKGVDRFEAWADLDRQIVGYYNLNTGESERKRCVEQILDPSP